MSRLTSSADLTRWVPVTGRGFRSGHRRRQAIRMLLGAQHLGAAAPLGGLLRWVANRATVAMMRNSDGAMLVWSWKDNAERLVAVAQLQALTSQLRTARAMMPMEYDDTESFSSPHLGTGEKLVMDAPHGPQGLLSVTYTWDTGSHLITVQGLSRDVGGFRTLIPSLDDLARTVRTEDDVIVHEGDTIIQLPPA